MNIKVEPCKNNVGANIICNLQKVSKEEIDQIKELINLKKNQEAVDAINNFKIIIKVFENIF